jgi:arabinoxylan arabinofuranohydrolase
MNTKPTGNPILPGLGVCDPHVRLFGDKAYLYATHDKAKDSTEFVMEDWWIWSSSDLVNWKHECTLRPEQTYIGAGFRSCWATDAAEKNGKYYWYLSEGSARTGVVVADTPTGPWRDPLGRALIGDGVIPTGAYDPGVFIDDDGTPYIVLGVWDYYIARLNDDMISLAEPPRKIAIVNPEGPYGPGKTDDKPYLHKRGGVYYLSWGCFYAMADSVYGPYDCRGSIVVEALVPATHRYKDHGITYDRHGSFFEWRGQWYFICNDMSQTGTMFYRDSSICRVNYRSNGEIEPVVLDPAGVGLPGWE